MKNYFKFKTKDEYLPEFIKDCIQNNSIIYHGAQIYTVDNKLIRKLKIEKLENKISDKDKEFLNYMISDIFIYYLTEEDCEKIKHNQSYTTNTTTFFNGLSGSSGGSGSSGTYNSGWSVGVGVGITSWP